MSPMYIGHMICVRDVSGTMPGHVLNVLELSAKEIVQLSDCTLQVYINLQHSAIKDGVFTEKSRNTTNTG